MLPHSDGKHTVVFFTVKTVGSKGLHENKPPSLQMSLKILLIALKDRTKFKELQKVFVF